MSASYRPLAGDASFGSGEQSDLVITDAVNAGISDVLSLTHLTTGVAASGIGIGLRLYAQDGAGNRQQVGAIQSSLTTVTDGAEVGFLKFSLISGGALPAAGKEQLQLFAAAGSLHVRVQAATNTSASAVTVRTESSGTATAGIGTSLAMQTRNGSGNVTNVAIPRAILTDVTNGAEIGSLRIAIINAGALPAEGSEQFTFNPTGLVTAAAVDVAVGGRLRGAQGADVPSGSTITCGTSGNYFVITGTTTINHITTTGWTAGSVVRFRFSASLTLTHNAGSPPANTAAMLLAGSANVAVTVNDMISMIYDGTNWRQATALLAV